MARVLVHPGAGQVEWGQDTTPTRSSQLEWPGAWTTQSHAFPSWAASPRRVSLLWSPRMEGHPDVITGAASPTSVPLVSPPLRASLRGCFRLASAALPPSLSDLCWLLLSSSPGHPQSFPGTCSHRQATYMSVSRTLGLSWALPRRNQELSGRGQATMPLGEGHAKTHGPAGPCPSAQTEQAGSRWFRSPDNTNACHKVTHCGTAVLWNTQSGQLYRSLETPSRWVVARVWAENGSDDK